MHDVIQRLVETEAEAKRMLEEARAEAERIVTEAQKKAADLMARSHKQTRSEGEEVIQTAVRDAEVEKQERLARAAAEIEAQVRLNETNGQHAVESVVRCVRGKG